MQTKPAVRSLKERQRQEREELILKVAEEVLTERGYYETSIDEIANRVGVAKGTVYLHFPSKDDLIVAIFERDMQSFEEEIDAVLADKQTVVERLHAMLAFLYHGLYSKRAQLLYSIYNSVDLRRMFMEKSGCMREIWQRLAARITTLLEEGKANGELQAQIPTSVMRSAFFSLLSPRSYERLVIGEHMDPEEMVGYLAQIYFGGISRQTL